MGLSKKVEEGLIFESEAKKRIVIAAAIPLRAPIFTKPELGKHEVVEEEGTTPRSKGTRISSRIQCPPAPRKPKSKPRCYFGGVREFFTAPTDLESLFIRRAEKA